MLQWVEVSQESHSDTHLDSDVINVFIEAMLTEFGCHLMIPPDAKIVLICERG